jgi:hypothetical protein
MSGEDLERRLARLEAEKNLLEEQLHSVEETNYHLEFDNVSACQYPIYT